MLVNDLLMQSHPSTIKIFTGKTDQAIIEDAVIRNFRENHRLRADINNYTSREANRC